MVMKFPKMNGKFSTVSDDNDEEVCGHDVSADSDDDDDDGSGVLSDDICENYA